MVKKNTWLLFFVCNYIVAFAQTPYVITDVNTNIEGVFCKDSPLVLTITGDFSNGCGAIQHAIHHIEDNGPEKRLTIDLDFYIPPNDTGCTQAILPFSYEYHISGLPEGQYDLVIWDEQNQDTLLESKLDFEIADCHEDEQFLFINDALVKDLFVCQNSNYQLNLTGYFPSDCPEIIGNSVFYNVDTIDVFFEFYPGDPPCSNESVPFNVDIELEADNTSGKLIRVFQEHIDGTLIDLGVNYLACSADTACLVEDILCYDWVEEELEKVNAYCDTCLLNVVSGFMFYHTHLNGMQIIELMKSCETTERIFFTCEGDFLNSCYIDSESESNCYEYLDNAFLDTELIWQCHNPICSTGLKAESLTKINVYPNPANETLYIEAPNGVRIKTQIIDLNDHVVLESINERTIDISSLTKGMYFILLDDEGSMLIETLIKL